MPKPKTFHFLIASILMLLCFKQYTFIFNKTLQQTQKFIQCGSNYEQLNNRFALYRTIDEVKHLLPPQARLKLLSRSNNLELTAVKYWLYPITIENKAPFLLDLHNANRQNEGLRTIILKTRKRLYVQKGHSFTQTSSNSKNNSSTKILFFFFSLSLFFTTVGLLILYCFSLSFTKNDCLWLLATGYLLGFCVCAMLIWSLMLLGMPLLFSSVAITWAIFFFCCLFFAFLQWNASRAAYDKPKQESTLINDPAPTQSHYAFAVNLLFIFISLSLTALIITTPLQSADSMGWILRAKVFYFNQTLDLSYLGKMFNCYPILWPINIASQFALFQGAFDPIVKWTNGLLFLIFIIQLLKGLSILKISPKISQLALMVYLAIFFAENPFNTGMPETLFMACLTCLLVLILLWINSTKSKQFLYLSVLFALTLSLVKLEGMFIAVFIILSLIIVKQGKNYKIVTPLFLMGLTTLFPVLWIYWTKTQGYFVKSVHFQSGLSWEKFYLLMNADFSHFIHKGEWIILLFPLIYLKLFSYKRKWGTSEIFLMAMSCFLLAFKWGAPTFWPIHFITSKGIFPDGAWRLFLHASPALFFLFARRAFDLRQRPRP